MKKFVTYVTGIMLISLGIGLFLLNQAGGFKVEKKDVNLTNSFNLDEIEEIEISSTSEAISIAQSPDNQAHFYLTGVMAGNANPRLDISEGKNDGVLKYSIDQSYRFLTFESFGVLNLKVEIPANYNKELSVKSVSGKIEIGNFSLSSLEAKSTSGRIKISNVAGPLDLRTVSGRIDADLNQVDGDINIETTSGRINLDLPKTIDGELNFESTSGGVHNNTDWQLSKLDRSSFEMKQGNGKYKIDIKSVSGGLDLNN